jgi:TolB-like protein/Flp pilus assembly protein TadD
MLHAGGGVMGNFLAELKRRHMFRVAAAYAVVAWLLLQIVNNIAPGLNLPNSAVTLIIVLLAVGFPVALVFAWIHELWAPSSADGTSAQAKITRLDFALVGGLGLVLAIFAYQQLAPSPGTSATQQASLVPGASQPQGQTAGISIAVLPLVNLSDDRAQEFFSDGMTEEITAALAKVSGLTVLGRTSAFQFKGQNRDLREIGQALGATHLIEGSVRKAGTRVRITAQLIRADSGAHLWTENYDRELTDIFAIQEEIAQAIAGALRVPLGLPQGGSLVSNRTDDLESYQQYLLARSLVRARGAGIPAAIAILEPLVARDPNYAPAWAQLAFAYYVLPTWSDAFRTAPAEEARRLVQSNGEKGDRAVQRAIQLDPKFPGGYWAAAAARVSHGEWSEGEDLFRQALALDPNDPDTLYTYGLSLAGAGRLKDALALRQKLRQLEPLVPIFNSSTAGIMHVNGQVEAAIQMLQGIPIDATGGYFRNVYLARAYAAAGRFSEAADTLLLVTSNMVSRQSVEESARLLRQAPTARPAPESLPRLESELSFVYAHVGALDRVLEFPERIAEVSSLTGAIIYPLWFAEYAPLRKTERFKALLRKAGLVEYWRQRGWPDLCRPVGVDDFVCE